MFFNIYTVTKRNLDIASNCFPDLVEPSNRSADQVELVVEVWLIWLTKIIYVS